MSKIIDKLKESGAYNVDKYHYACPCCGGDLYSVSPKMLNVLDGNRVHQCENEKEHKFWKNARERGPILHQNKNASETDFTSEQDWAYNFLKKTWFKQEDVEVEEVSFDFDGTLNEHFHGSANTQQDSIRNMFVQMVESPFYNVRIITRRFGPEDADKGVKNEYTTVYGFIDGLYVPFPKENALFTNRKYKYSLINKLEIKIHFDDDPQEHALIKKYTNASSVDVSQPNWRKELDGLL